jgi:hypothetical protein
MEGSGWEGQDVQTIKLYRLRTPRVCYKDKSVNMFSEIIIIIIISGQNSRDFEC